MQPEVIAVCIPIVATIGFFTMLIFWRKFQNDERMAMIERGMSPADLDIPPTKRSFKVNPSITLRIGALAVGAGVGLLIADILDHYTDLGDMAYPTMLLIGGGAGLLLAYFFQLNLDKKTQKEN